MKNQGFTTVKPTFLLLLCVAFPSSVDRSPPLFFPARPSRPGPARPGLIRPGMAQAGPGRATPRFLQKVLFF